MFNDIDGPAVMRPETEKARLFGQFIGRYSALFDKWEPLETVLTDILADLFHIVAATGEDLDGVIESARMHFEDEHAAGDDRGVTA